MRFQETGVSLGELDRAVELEVLLFARRNRNRCMSSYLPLIFEVPQETILVPILISLFILCYPWVIYWTVSRTSCTFAMLMMHSCTFPFSPLTQLSNLNLNILILFYTCFPVSLLLSHTEANGGSVLSVSLQDLRKNCMLKCYETQKKCPIQCPILM